MLVRFNSHFAERRAAEGMRNLRDMTIAARSMSAVKTSASEWQAEMHSHKSGKLKQDNKKHKAPFASKRAVERGASGRVETTKSKFKATGFVHGPRACRATNTDIAQVDNRTRPQEPSK